jgi:hypothetical protein
MGQVGLKRKLKTESGANKNDPRMLGVSLRYLSSLPIAREASFNEACSFVKEKTRQMTGYRSLAMFLQQDRRTRHFVRNKPNVFVSYAWKGGWGATMDALTQHFEDSLYKTFVWMDFAVIDQHAAETTNIDFEEWRETFKSNLLAIGRAILVLAPGEKPIAISRSWCCFEWVVIAESGIPFEYCVPQDDVAKLIMKMQYGMGFAHFNDLFAAINVEKAEAFKPSDQEAILELMRKVGIVKVNDIVMKSLKAWCLNVVKEAISNAADGTRQKANALNACADLHRCLVSLPCHG